MLLRVLASARLPILFTLVNTWSPGLPIHFGAIRLQGLVNKLFLYFLQYLRKVFSMHYKVLQKMVSDNEYPKCCNLFNQKNYSFVLQTIYRISLKTVK